MRTAPEEQGPRVGRQFPRSPFPPAPDPGKAGLAEGWSEASDAPQRGPARNSPRAALRQPVMGFGRAGKRRGPGRAAAAGRACVPRSRPWGSGGGGASEPPRRAQGGGSPPQRPASWTPSCRCGPGCGLRAGAGAGVSAPSLNLPCLRSALGEARCGAAGGDPRPAPAASHGAGGGRGEPPPSSRFSYSFF